jgi:hypothetical protein
VEELTIFSAGVNLANTLTRRREAYHEQTALVEDGNGNVDLPQGEGDSSSAPSIHDLEGNLRFSELPPVDGEDRALFQERVLEGDLELEVYQRGDFHVLHSWARQGLEVLAVVGGKQGGSVDSTDEERRWVEIILEDAGRGTLEKRIRFLSDGAVEVLYKWDPSGFPEDALFTTELSLGAAAEVVAVPDSTSWRFPISTFSKTERGFDETVQGESVTIRWPIVTGWGRVRLARR